MRGHEHPGILKWNPGTSIGGLIEYAETVARVLSPDEARNSIEYA